MKTKIIAIVLTVVLGINFLARSDEGLWLPLLVKDLNYDDMRKMGLNLSPEEIYSINNSSLKDAIVQFSDYSSGSVISPDGLIITSHNSGLDYIRSHSNIQNDYVTNGFWSMSREEELPNPGLSVTFLVRMENVTKKVLSKLKDDMDEQSRIESIKHACAKIESRTVGKTHYTAEVKSFCNDMEFFLFVYETFTDIRLVGAPPFSIGKYGGDQDNWKWPRHTGDFSLFRIYTGPDGKPAEFSEENIPYKPNYHLTISLNGIEENDFTMTMGYPIHTSRYLNSEAVSLKMNETNPTLKKLKDKKLKVLINSMDENDENRLLYTTKFAQTSNYAKFYLGQNKQLKRFKVYEKKKQLENDFQKWANQDIKREVKYGSVIGDIHNSYKQIEKYNLYRQYYSEVICNGADLMVFVNKFYPIYKELKSNGKNKDHPFKIPEDIKESARSFIKNVDLETDKKIFHEQFALFYNNVDSTTKEQHPEIFASIPVEFNGDISWFTNTIYSKSMFTDFDALWHFIINPDLRELENDFAFKLLLSCMEKEEEINNILEESYLSLNKSNRLFKEGYREMNPERNFYCDANSSMRLSYGRVLGCAPMDGTVNNYYTTLSGVMEKWDKDDPEYFVPEKLVKLYEEKDYGYYSENDVMNVCFISNNDVSGGSAGSPVINGNGQMVGLVFDLNWEGMSGDLCYEASVNRTINVDMRYVLFVIDKFAGAKHLVDEMTISQNYKLVY